jgi:divalent metal cation (Fe/Co/Zn/Cd) transporter
VTTTHSHVTVVSDEDRRRFGRRAQLLAGASVGYNVVEAVIAITAGLVAGSVALVGFGLDSVVEVSSGLIILWQFRHALPESRERTALRLMALSFFALAAYVTFGSVRALATGDGPEASRVGIVLACVSLLVMPFLSWAQRRTGRALGSNAVAADSGLSRGGRRGASSRRGRQVPRRRLLPRRGHRPGRSLHRVS